MSANPATEEAAKSAQDALNAHLREIINWHFSPETGCPFWLDWAAKQDWNPLTEVQTSTTSCAFRTSTATSGCAICRTKSGSRSNTRAKPFNIFETGGTTGMPKQRIGWEDYKIDYSKFSESLADEDFPRNGYWLMIGPTGPRRLRLVHRAPRQRARLRLLLRRSRPALGEEADHPRPGRPGQGLHGARHRSGHDRDQQPQGRRLFTTPEAARSAGRSCSRMTSRFPTWASRASSVGGTQMDPQYTRFLIEEVLEERVEVRADLRQHPDGPVRKACPSPRRTSFPSPTTRRSRAPCCGSSIRRHGQARRLRRLGPRRAHDPDPGAVHAALP